MMLRLVGEMNKQSDDESLEPPALIIVNPEFM